MKRSLIIGGAIAALSIPAVAQMTDRQERAEPMTRAQIEARIKQRFDRADTNRDGAVTRDEIAERREARREDRRDRAFARMDADGNGSISRAEFDDAGERRAERRAERGAKRMGKHHGRRHAMAGMMWGRADANDDGRITLSEALARPLERFDRADSNRDGTLTLEERRDAREKMREQWRERRERRS